MNNLPDQWLCVRPTVVTSIGTLAPERNANRETVILRCKPSGRRAGLRRSAPNSRNRRAFPAFSPASKGALMLLALLICSCVPTTIDTVPLQQASLAPLQSETVSSGGYRLQTLPIGEKAPDLLVIVAMSGVVNGQPLIHTVRSKVCARSRCPESTVSIHC